MCSGPVPQHPPRKRAPASAMRAPYLPKNAGVERYIRRPPTSCGSPAFGCATRGVPVTAAIRHTTSSISGGPVEQLAPITSAPDSSSLRATDSTSSPSDERPPCEKVTWAKTGRSEIERTAPSAASSSGSSEKVSRTNPSMPPSRSPSACSREVSLDLGPGCRTRRGHPESERTDRPEDRGLLAGSAPGEFGRSHVDLSDPLLESETGEPDSICPEAVRLHDLRARLDVVSVDGFDELGRAQVYRIVAGVHEDAAFVEARPHRTVEEVESVPGDHGAEPAHEGS